MNLPQSKPKAVIATILYPDFFSGFRTPGGMSKGGRRASNLNVPNLGIGGACGCVVEETSSQPSRLLKDACAGLQLRTPKPKPSHNSWGAKRTSTLRFKRTACTLNPAPSIHSTKPSTGVPGAYRLALRFAARATFRCQAIKQHVRRSTPVAPSATFKLIFETYSIRTPFPVKCNCRQSQRFDPTGYECLM